MKLEFFDIDAFAADLKEITSPKIYTKNGFHPEGLFSLQIFGPIKTATCGCPIYYGRSMIGETCQTCGVDITHSSERRRRFAKIALPFPVLNPIMYHLIIKAGKNKFKTIIDTMILNPQIHGYCYDSESGSYQVMKKTFKERESDEEEEVVIPEGVTFYKAVIGLKDLIQDECNRQKENDALWRLIDEHMGKFYINNILVPPPEFRPVSKNRDAQMRDEINRYLNTILNFSLTMTGNVLNDETSDGIYEISSRNLHRHVYEFYNYIFSKLSKKRGLIRGSILGKRLDFSGRAVIVPDPTLTLEECSIPYLMALELFKLEVANMLLEKRVVKRYDSAITLIEKTVRDENYDLYEIASEAIAGKYVILNRQPTLHRMGILGFRVKVNKDSVIRIHPLICEPYNADFDGDAMAIYRPLYEDSINECRNKLLVTKNLLSPTTGDLILGVNQDIVLGLYLLTKDGNTDKTVVDGVETYQGRVVFNDCLPNDYPFINKVIDKKMLKIILNDITKTYHSDQVISILDDLKDLGFRYTTLYGSTMSLYGFDLKPIKEIASNIFKDDKLDWRQKFEKLQSKEVLETVKTMFPSAVFIESGSRGSWDQANQIILARGFVSNFNGEIIKEPIENSLVTGLTRKEFFNSCYGSRKGLLDTALNTGVSGYLTRKLMYATVNLESDESCEDCGTEETLTISIPDGQSGDINGKKLARSMIGRNIIDGHDADGNPIYKKITYQDYNKYVGKTINLRSPIFCKNPKVCKKCYGDMAEHIHSKFIGAVAAQALGEVSTQLVLRTFHTSGVAKMSQGKDSNQQQDISNDLSKVNKIFHNSGSYLKSYDHAVIELFKIYSEYKNILFIHYECIVSQMMRRDNMLWRLTQDRDPTNYELVSVEGIPSRESWLLALAFSKPKSYLIDGVVDDSATSGILETIMMNQM